MLRLRILLALSLLTVFLPGEANADRSYTVRSGDTLARIARRFHVNIRSIRRANRLRGDNIRQGTRLTIPGVGGSAREARRNGRHVVRRGDTLGGIARRYRVSVRELRRANRLRGDNIRLGSQLRIPGRRRENRLPRVAVRPVRASAAENAARAEELGLGSVRAAHQLMTAEPDPRWAEAAADAPTLIPSDAYGVGTPIDPDQTPSAIAEEEQDVPEGHEVPEEDDEDLEVAAPEGEGDEGPEPPAGPGTLRLPVDDGIFLRGWGSGPGGYHLAVDIYAPPGTPVHAAARGIVAYAGTGLRGYGRFILIVHPSGRVSAYAHNRENLVTAGERVAKGQIISLLGNTGLSRGPHVHFMYIQNGEHCDPLPLIRPRIRHRGGRLAETSPATWTFGGEQPEEVQCLPRSARPHPGTRRRRRGNRRR